MRGTTAEEHRVAQLQRLAQLGVAADDACLSTFAYPSLGPSEVQSLGRLRDSLTPAPAALPGSRIERSSALHDTEDLLLQVVQLAGGPHQSAGPPQAPSAILNPLSKMLDGTADADEVLVVRAFSEALSRVTLMLSEQISHEKDSQDWTTIPSTFSGVL